MRAEPMYSGRIQYTDPYYGDPAGTASDVGLFGKVTLNRLVRVATRKWITIGAVVGFALCAALIYLAFTPRVYRADSLIEMNMRKPRILGSQSAVIDDTDTTCASRSSGATRPARSPPTSCA